MAELNLKLDISKLKGVGPRRAELLQKLGIRDLGALLSYYPRAYDDLTKITPISEAHLLDIAVIKAEVQSKVTEHFIRKGMVLYKTVVFDGTETLNVTIFNNKYLANRLIQGKEYIFFGKVNRQFGKNEMASPDVETNFKRQIRPIYRQTQGIYSNFIENLVADVLRVSGGLIDPLPQEILQKYGLCSLEYAINNIHRPMSFEALDLAKKRLIFEELLLLSLGMKRLKFRSMQHTKSIISKDYSDEFWHALPFEPTGAQRRAVSECVNNLYKPYPMNRLIQGDVGSGKTAVAACVCYTMIKNGYQCALMAPTEILAEQHARSLETQFEGLSIKIALLTGSVSAKDKRVILEQLKSGEINFIIGTHALIQDSVEFNKLGLVVTDEQHRFGVAQRAALISKGESPHLLVMSATPIPRTLALIIYGDLSISVLDELPKGRQVIETYAVDIRYRERIYKFIKKHVDDGSQAYIVCPLIEEGESDIASAVEYAEKLKDSPLSSVSIGVLHGKLKPAQKDEVMRNFANGDIKVLVATTVVEVGVDVPNAVVMVIEHADRFGLSQLHQLRGRVGRGKKQSYCVLISHSNSEISKQRIKVMCDTTDGFKIADEDLKNRGPGDFFGSKQHGLPDLKIANMADDIDILHQAAICASEIFEQDNSLTSDKYQRLGRKIDDLFQQKPEGSFN